MFAGVYGLLERPAEPIQLRPHPQDERANVLSAGRVRHCSRTSANVASDCVGDHPCSGVVHADEQRRADVAAQRRWRRDRLPVHDATS